MGDCASSAIWSQRKESPAGSPPPGATPAAKRSAASSRCERATICTGTRGASMPATVARRASVRLRLQLHFDPSRTALVELAVGLERAQERLLPGEQRRRLDGAVAHHL